ncbi:MBL fold metallo-hydrolase [Angustibacter luteus]|uniref:MBL fold metallo-hydrolase n=1 Tax=Angustibacter luteus TaxID=658456 RepID=A0ABW1JA34_9ACTN
MSDYSGDVVQGGPTAVRELSHLVVRKASVSEQDNNAYLLTCVQTGEQLLVDAADDAPRLLALMNEGTGWLDAVVTTHQHWDHHRALPEVVAHTGARVAAGADDAEALPVPVGELLHHGDRVTFGNITLEVIYLRGHTPGSVALLYRDPDGVPHLFTGDSLFPGGVGNTQGDAERFASLLTDVEQRIFDVLPDETWFYPGHGADSTLGEQRPHLAEWRERGW